MNRPILCCLKIKSATLLIGFIDLFFHLFMLSSLLVSLANMDNTNTSSPPWLDHYYTNSIGLITFSSSMSSSISSTASCLSPSSLATIPKPPPLPSLGEPIALPSSSSSSSYDLHQQFARLSRNPASSSATIPKDKSMAFMITIFSLLITCMLMYGVLKSRPSYLMPYFSVKVFQLVMAALTTLGFYTCLPSVRLWIEAHESFPFRSIVLLVDNQTLELFVFALLLTSILIKLYEAVIVWYCYRYMVTLESFRNMNPLMSGGIGGSAGSSTNNGIVFVDDDGTNTVGGPIVLVKRGVDDDDESDFGAPPKYDEIFKAACRKKSSSSPTSDVEPSTSTHSNNVLSSQQQQYIPSYSAAVRSITFPV